MSLMKRVKTRVRSRAKGGVEDLGLLIDCIRNAMDTDVDARSWDALEALIVGFKGFSPQASTRMRTILRHTTEGFKSVANKKRDSGFAFKYTDQYGFNDRWDVLVLLHEQGVPLMSDALKGPVLPEAEKKDWDMEAAIKRWAKKAKDEGIKDADDIIGEFRKVFNELND